MKFKIFLKDFYEEIQKYRTLCFTLSAEDWLYDTYIQAASIDRQRNMNTPKKFEYTLITPELEWPG